jgi:anti-sigma B factor antagonist
MTDSPTDQWPPISYQAGFPVVTPPADIDWQNAGRLNAALAQASLDHPTVIVDMSGNTYCDSSGLRVLMTAVQRAQATGGSLRLVLPPDGHTRRVFKVIGIDRLTTIFGSISAAAAAETPPPPEAGQTPPEPA